MRDPVDVGVAAEQGADRHPPRLPHGPATTESPRTGQASGTGLSAATPTPTTCAFGPDGCDPQGGELVRCEICGEPACDYHGDYPNDEAYVDGDWRCPDHVERR